MMIKNLIKNYVFLLNIFVCFLVFWSFLPFFFFFKRLISDINVLFVEYPFVPAKILFYYYWFYCFLLFILLYKIYRIYFEVFGTFGNKLLYDFSVKIFDYYNKAWDIIEKKIWLKFVGFLNRLEKLFFWLVSEIQVKVPFSNKKYCLQRLVVFHYIYVIFNYILITVGVFCLYIEVLFFNKLYYILYYLLLLIIPRFFMFFINRLISFINYANEEYKSGFCFSKQETTSVNHLKLSLNYCVVPDFSLKLSYVVFTKILDNKVISIYYVFDVHKFPIEGINKYEELLDSFCLNIGKKRADLSDDDYFFFNTGVLYSIAQYLNKMINYKKDFLLLKERLDFCNLVANFIRTFCLFVLLNIILIINFYS